MIEFINKPSRAFIAASWSALAMGAGGFIIGLYNAQMIPNEKGYYFTLLLYGLFSVASLQKTVRDRLESIPVTDTYYFLCWLSTFASIGLLAMGLFNANLLMSEKGFYIMAFAMALFGTLTAQKNVRDVEYLRRNSKQLKNKSETLEDEKEV